MNNIFKGVYLFIQKIILKFDNELSENHEYKINVDCIHETTYGNIRHFIVV
jgi:hypothetical protein